MIKCKECGLLERRDENSCCLRFEREIAVEEIRGLIPDGNRQLLTRQLYMPPGRSGEI